jgi:hypothetical protein
MVGVRKDFDVPTAFCILDALTVVKKITASDNNPEIYLNKVFRPTSDGDTLVWICIFLI